MTSMVEAAQHLACDLGWPVLPVTPRGKQPLTPHGVKDATTDERRLLHYWERWPDANVGVATGSPGPTVLDIDNPKAAAFLLAQLQADHPPEAATARGRHLYFAGTDRGTIALGFGELRGRGSYVVCPPSIHPDGKTYTWLVEPDGLALPQVPASLTRAAPTAGAGVMAPRDRVSHGQRHDHLKDLATRLVRSGVVDPGAIERALCAEYDAVCDQDPPARPSEFIDLATWATQTRIAGRERARSVNGARSGSVGEHRQLVDASGGWAPLAVSAVKRYGNRLVDALHIYLDDGSIIDFPRQGDITVRGHWPRTVIAGTDGQAGPPALKDQELHNLYRSLCVLAGKSRAQMEADDHADFLADLLSIASPLTGHSTHGTADRFALIAALRALPKWDPSDRQTLASPTLIVDQGTGDEYLRAGDLMAYFQWRGAQIHTREFPGRMTMIGLEHVRLSGREPPLMGGRRATNTAMFYRLFDPPNESESDDMSDQPTTPPADPPDGDDDLPAPAHFPDPATQPAAPAPEPTPDPGPDPDGPPAD